MNCKQLDKCKNLGSNKTLSMALSFGDYFLKNKSKNSKGSIWNMPENNLEVEYNNPENIDSGESGIILFLIELYKYLKDSKFLDLIIESTDNLFERCKTVTTDNYALYTGRSGLAFLLISIFYLTHDHEYLKKACDVLRKTSHKYLKSSNTTDYLYNGRSGTLLVTCKLYCLTKEPFLLELANKLLERIIENARLTESGISWKVNEEINLRDSCSFAYGAAGIQYILSQINKISSNKSLEFIIHEIEKYQNSCWVKNFKNWGDFRKDILDGDTYLKYTKKYKKEGFQFDPENNLSWANGYFGICNINKPKKKKIDDKLNNIIYEINNYPINLHEGLAGISLCLINEECKSDVILTYLNDQVDDKNVDLTGGLFHGNLGVMYSILKNNNKERFDPQNVLFPEIDCGNQVSIPLRLELKNNIKKLISKKYERTLIILEEINTERLNDFYEKIRNDNCFKFEKFDFFLNEILKEMSNKSAAERLRDIIGLEKKRYNFRNLGEKSFAESYFHEIHFHLDIMNLLKNSDNWLMNQVLRISDKIEVIETKWDWSKNKSDLVENLLLSPNEYKTLFTFDRNVSASEIDLSDSKIIINQFIEPKRVKDVLVNIKSNPEELNREYSLDKIRLLNSLDFLILDSIRKLIYWKVLVINQPPKIGRIK